MKTTTESMVEQLKLLQRAATIDVERSYNSIAETLEYRKRVAQALVKETNEEICKHLQENLDRCNDLIKSALALN